jgi:hypothetical protein
MTNIILPHIVDKKMHDGLIMKWPHKCHSCPTKECNTSTTDINLCSYGYNYTQVNSIVLAGFISPEHRSSSRAKAKKIKSEKSQTINLHLVENQKAIIRQKTFAENTIIQEKKNRAREDFLNKESFRDDFILEIKEEIFRNGVGFIVPLAFNILINPPFCTTNKRESPACAIARGFEKPVANDCKPIF